MTEPTPAPPAPPPAAPAPTEAERAELRRHGILLTSLEELYNWGRSRSVWPLQFGLACCAIEMIAASMARFDIARFGSEVFRPSPRQADLLIVSGTVTKKMAPQVVRLWNQMPEPKYCIAMGACAISGGPFKQEKIRGQKISGPDAPRHLRADQACDYPVPDFGEHDLVPPQNPAVWHPPAPSAPEVS